MNSTISHNALSGIHCATGSTTIINCIITENTNTSIGGGGILCYNCEDSWPIITNCTITRNTSTPKYGGGIKSEYSSPTITNCIVWGNNGSGIWDADLWACDATYSCTSVGSYGDGEGNIDFDPLFVNTKTGDYQLRPGSPCIDAANGSVALVTDRDGMPRHDDPGTANTGVGNPDYVDIGAYEFQDCTGDFDQNCLIDDKDLDIFSGYWLYQGCNVDPDFDGNCRVDLADFAVFAKAWACYLL